MATTPTRPVSSEQSAREEDLLARVQRSFDACPDPRLREIMHSVVQHLHAVVREVRLTGPEWNAAIEFLTAAGRITDDKRQEFVLLSDTLGISMQAITVNDQARGQVTEATVLGPFFVEGSPRIALGGDMSFGADGEPCWIEGTVTDEDGTPLPGAKIEVWEADANGRYDVQYSDQHVAGRAHLFTAADGSYQFWGLTPTPYPIPHDGPVGRMLAAAGRSPMRASHLHFMVTANGCRTLVTHIFVRGDDLLGSDTVFGVKDSLIRDFKRQAAGAATPDGRAVHVSWTRVRFDIVLARDVA